MKRPKPDRAEVIALIVVGGLATTLLFLPPFIGLADQGDFFRLMHWGKFVYPPLESRDQFVGWVTRQYLVERSPLLSWWGFPSSEALFIKTSSLLGLILSRQYFDLRILGFVHVFGFAGASALLLRGWRAALPAGRIILLPAILLVFCDIGYLTYFHSFYGEPASLIFMLATVGLGLILVGDRRHSISILILFHASAFCLVTAKPQNLPFVVAFLLFGAWLHFDSTDVIWRRVNLAGLGLIVLVAATILLVIPLRMKEANLYNSVFNGILRDSESAADDLAALGLPRELEALKGTSYFDTYTKIDTRGEEFRSKFYSNTGAARVVVFYLTHPARYLEKLAVTSNRAYTLRPPALGNFEKQSGNPFSSKTARWTFWSRAKERYLPRSVWFSLGYLGGLLLLIANEWRRCGRRGLAVFLFALWLMMVISFVSPIAGDGENDLEKHLFLFNAFFDLSVILVASSILGLIWPRGGLVAFWPRLDRRIAS